VEGWEVGTGRKVLSLESGRPCMAVRAFVDQASGRQRIVATDSGVGFRVYDAETMEVIWSGKGLEDRALMITALSGYHDTRTGAYRLLAGDAGGHIHVWEEGRHLYDIFIGARPVIGMGFYASGTGRLCLTAVNAYGRMLVYDIGEATPELLVDAAEREGMRAANKLG
jgi:hypothetical protein